MFDPVNIIFRVILALILLFIATRFLNNRSLSSITYLNYIATATLGTIAGNLAFNIRIGILNFVLAGILITSTLALASYVSLINRPLRKFLTGECTVIIKDGKILEQNMAKLNFSFDYLNEKLRLKQIFDISKVDYAVLEPTGELSVKLKPSERPLTPGDINLSAKSEGVALEIILDGQIIEENLGKRNLKMSWLMNELRNKGITNIDEVAFAALATNGNLYIDRFKDQIQSP